MATPEDTKKCPYCAETIKAEAIVCRYCGRDLVPNVESVVRGKQRRFNQAARPAQGSTPFWDILIWVLVGGAGLLAMVAIVLLVVVFFPADLGPRLATTQEELSTRRSVAGELAGSPTTAPMSEPLSEVASPEAPAVESTPAPTPTESPTTLSTPTVEPADTTPVELSGELSPEDYKAQAEVLDVRDLIRNTETYEGRIIRYYGRILQVIEDRAMFSDRVTYSLRFAVDDNIDTTVLASLVYESGQGLRPVDDDYAVIWGLVEGRASYETVLGAKITLPQIAIKYIELAEQQVGSQLAGSVSGTPASTPLIEIVSHRSYSSETRFWIVGEVINRSDYPVESVEIAATMYGNDNRIIDTEDTYAALSAIPPGGKSPFEIIVFESTVPATYSLQVQAKTGKPPRQDLVIRSQEATWEEERLYIRGEVENTGTSEAQFVKVVVTFYGADGRVTGMAYSYALLDTIPSGGTSPYETYIDYVSDVSGYIVQVQE